MPTKTIQYSPWVAFRFGAQDAASEMWSKCVERSARGETLTVQEKLILKDSDKGVRIK